MLERPCGRRKEGEERLKQYFVAVIIGTVIGVIDIIPMVMKKLPKDANVSAFLQYFFLSFLIVFINLPGIVWWIQGPLISLCMAIPIIIITAKKDKQTIGIISSMSIILGFCISLLKEILL